MALPEPAVHKGSLGEKPLSAASTVRIALAATPGTRPPILDTQLRGLDV
jgi:hypothetical protein